jgi:hypothetical protein
VNERSAVRFLAQTAPWLAPLPSAWFVGRSVYLHLLLGWQLAVHPAVNVAVAALCGLVVETLGIVSVHNTLALVRWNNHGHVRKQGGWEKAPVPLSLACVGIYFTAVGVLLVLLEAVPVTAIYTPPLFAVLAAIGAMNLGILDQHLDRLDRYGMEWNLSKTKVETPRTVPEPKVEVPEPKVPELPVLDLDDLDRAILDAFHADPDATYQKVAETVGSAKSTIGARVQRLRLSGTAGRMTIQGCHRGSRH